MTDSDLAAILERCEKATEGPWGYEETNVCGGSEPRTWYEVGPIIAADYTGPQEIDWTEEVCATAGDAADWEQQEANADFIAHARTDLPLVVKELQTARRLLERLADGASCLDVLPKAVVAARDFLGVSDAES